MFVRLTSIILALVVSTPLLRPTARPCAARRRTLHLLAGRAQAARLYSAMKHAPTTSSAATIIKYYIFVHLVIPTIHPLSSISASFFYPVFADKGIPLSQLQTKPLFVGDATPSGVLDPSNLLNTSCQASSWPSSVCFTLAGWGANDIQYKFSDKGEWLRNNDKMRLHYCGPLRDLLQAPEPPPAGVQTDATSQWQTRRLSPYSSGCT
ncbi:hypothetical protein BU15DRAFT_62293 [Melanogaster broomeanus]|nr:hypothetical protein BU15DRAFT_62293 [Melanogaster broomeanus]